MVASWIKVLLCWFMISIAVTSGYTSAASGAQKSAHQILAFYYGWWGNPPISHRWVHWKGVDKATGTTHNTADYPASGAYDSHDPVTVERQVVEAKAAGITGFVASWWGPGGFEDGGMPLLLAAASKHDLAVSAYIEKIDGADVAARVNSAVIDLTYLLTRYGSNAAWLHASGKPVIFVYGRALHALTPAEWQQVRTRLRQANRQVLLVADSTAKNYVSVFDGTSTYNITGQIKYKSPQQAGAWAHNAYPKMVAVAGPNEISTVTIIPGYDDRKTGRPAPRPVTYRYGGEVYAALWQEAIAANPDYVLITSWNEWHEGSELEPSVQYGSTILDRTPAFARQFLAGDRARRK